MGACQVETVLKPSENKIFNESGVSLCCHLADSHLYSFRWGSCCGGGIATSSQPVLGVVCVSHQEGFDKTQGRKSFMSCKPL